MRYRDILHEALERTYDKPLVRTVGADFPDTFLHGTARKNLKSLTGERPDSSIKRSTGKEFFDFLFPPEVNEFGAELFLSEPRQPQQANMFSQGRGNTLAVVRLKPGSRILDLSDEVARAPQVGLGGPEILRFFHRPAITDDLITFQLGRIYPGYKERHPDWQQRITASMDPASPEFWIDSWRNALVPYAHARGFAAIRFADEVLLIDRAAILDVRPARPKEREAAATTRTYRGASSASLFTDQPTGAHDEYEVYHRGLKESADQRTEGDRLNQEIEDARRGLAAAKEARDRDAWIANLMRFNRAARALNDLESPATVPDPQRTNAYAGEHEAPDHESGAPLHDLAGVYPADFYTGRSRNYGDNARCIGIMLGLHNRPNATIRVYRAVPQDAPRKINPGDWVTIDRQYAVAHGRDNLRNNYRIVSKAVFARDLFTDGSVEEWGYDPHPRVRRKSA